MPCSCIESFNTELDSCSNCSVDFSEMEQTIKDLQRELRLLETENTSLRGKLAYLEGQIKRGK